MDQRERGRDQNKETLSLRQWAQWRELIVWYYGESENKGPSGEVGVGNPSAMSGRWEGIEGKTREGEEKGTCLERRDG